MTSSGNLFRIIAALGAMLLACPSTLAAGAATFNVRDQGAVGDGRAIDGPAINRAIAAAAAAGGGTVYFPAGAYLSYSIRLKSNVALYLDQGATIIAAEPSVDLTTGYDAPEPNPGADRFEDFGHSHWHNSLIWGENLENISILGPGRIFGRGLSRRSNRRDLLPEERALPVAAQPDLSLPAEARALIAAQKPGTFGYPDKDTLPAGVGNKAIGLKRCRNVIFRDFTLYHGGHFAILATGVDNWTCDNLKIDTNRDGIDFDCCQNVRVSNCTVNSPNDDGICPKSSFALGYNRATENVTITNCRVSGFDEGTLLDGTRQRAVAHKVGGGPTGRIKCGTESNGGFRNLTISNCVFEYCRGLAFESVDGASMEDITVSNVTMRDIVNAPIFIRLGARLRGPAGTKVGTARRIRISNLVASHVTADQGILLVGAPGAPLEDIELSHILIDYVGGGTKEQAAREVPELEEAYPDPSRYGILPSYGMFARHVNRLRLDHVELRSAREDLRPCIFLQDVAGAEFDHLKAAHAAATPVFVRRGVTDDASTPCLDVLPRFTAPNVPAFAPTEIACSDKYKDGITLFGLPGNGLAEHPMLYVGENCNTMFVVNGGKVIWTYSTGPRPEFDDVWMLSNGNVLFSRMEYVAEITPDKRVIWRYDAHVPKDAQHTEIHACQPIGLDKVMFVENGLPPRLKIINLKSGAVEVDHELPFDAAHGVHGQFRRTRVTAQGTYLVPFLGLNRVVEYDRDFKEVWKYDIPKPWAAIRLKNGHTLITDEKDSLTREVDSKGATVWEFDCAKDLPPQFQFTSAPQSCTRLANGNTVFASRGKAGAGPQLIEVTPAKEVVWVLHDWKHIGDATAVQFLDDPGIPEIPGESEH